jgi:hypothetical protein
MNRALALSIASAVTALALVTGAALPATAAGMPTITSFVGGTEVEASFGSEWELTIQVVSNAEYGRYNVAANDGTVDIYVEGMPGAYIAAAQIYPGGVTYFTQPSDKPMLAAGEYTVSAIFTPSSGSRFATSKTAKPVTLTITPLAVTTSVELLTDPAVVTVPTVRTSLTGEYADLHGAPPSGTWTVTGEDSAGSETFSITAAQPTESNEGMVGPLDIPITDELQPGETYTVTTIFEPDPLVAPGISFENVAPESFTTTPLTFAENLSTPVVVPLWVTILNGLLLIVLVMGIVWIIGAWSRRRPVEVDVAADATATSALPAAPSPAALEAAPGDRAGETSIPVPGTEDDPKQG